MEKRSNNTRRANLTLGGVTLGFLLSYPFHMGFVGGLISSGCSAGMIGGLADWFAVSALFRRPLGIRPGRVLRTEIIPRNRERIFTALADMVQDELLSVDVLKRQFAAWDFSSVILRTLAEEEVREGIILLLTEMGLDLLHHIEPEDVTHRIQRWLEANGEKLNFAAYLESALQSALERGQVDNVLAVLCRALEGYMNQFVVRQALTTWMEAAFIRYGEKNPSRKLVSMFLPPSDVLAQGVYEKAKTALQDGTVQQELKVGLRRWLRDLSTNPIRQAKINHLVIEWLHKSLKNPEVREKIMSTFGTSAKEQPDWMRQVIVGVRDQWDSSLYRLEQNTTLRAKTNDRIRSFLEKEIVIHQNAIGNMVRDGLEPLTNDRLVALIEDKAGNDLQMIRINGSVVGGLAGMLIFVLTWFLH